MYRKRRRTLPGIVFVAGLIGTASFSALSPSTAFACTPVTNPDGSKTCSQTYSDVPCPSATGAGNAVTAYAVEFVPAGATVTGHTLSFSPDPPCQNATVEEVFFEDNASSPVPPLGEKTVKLAYKITCNTTPCGPGTNPQTTFTVTYTEPTGGGGAGSGGIQSTSPPDASAAKLPATASVNPKTGKGTVKVQVALTTVNFDVAMFFVSSGFVPEEPRNAFMSKRKFVNGGTITGTVPGGQPGVLSLQLNGKGRRALRRAGKLKVQTKGSVSNTAGSTPLSGKLTLVASK